MIFSYENLVSAKLTKIGGHKVVSIILSNTTWFIIKLMHYLCQSTTQFVSLKILGLGQKVSQNYWELKQKHQNKFQINRSSRPMLQHYKKDELRGCWSYHQKPKKLFKYFRWKFTNLKKDSSNGWPQINSKTLGDTLFLWNSENFEKSLWSWVLSRKSQADYCAVPAKTPKTPAKAKDMLVYKTAWIVFSTKTLTFRATETIFTEELTSFDNTFLKDRVSHTQQDLFNLWSSKRIPLHLQPVKS